MTEGATTLIRSKRVDGEPGHRPLPAVWPWLLKGFGLYARSYLSRHFHAVRLSGSVAPSSYEAKPLIIYLNHASWWDPLVCLLLQLTLWRNRTGFAPIAAEALQRYPMFSRLGFFGVEQSTTRGARVFLQTSLEILRQSEHTLWITPQGRFQDVRERPVRFQPGLGHLASRVAEGTALPLAIEYVFWEERLPEILLRFGKPIELGGKCRFAAGDESWTGLLQERLEDAQNALALAARDRQTAAFTTLLGGRAGVNVIYDAWRRVSALWRGSHFNPKHGAL